MKQYALIFAVIANTAFAAPDAQKINADLLAQAKEADSYTVKAYLAAPTPKILYYCQNAKIAYLHAAYSKPGRFANLEAMTKDASIQCSARGTDFQINLIARN